MAAELRQQLERRLQDFDGYLAPLSEKGKSVIEEAKDILSTAKPTIASLERIVDRLEHPETTWFEPMIGEWQDEHLQMLRETTRVNATFGCSHVCDFCSANAPPIVSVAPYPWLLEIRQNSERIGKKSFELMDLSDPLRDYYDPVFRRHFGHVNDLFPNPYVRTRGVFRDSPSEQAALFIKEHFPETKFHVSIDIVNKLYRVMGKEGFIEFLRHSVELFRPNVSFNQNGTTLLGEQDIFIEVWNAVTGENTTRAVGASYAGRFLQLDASRYDNVEPWRDDGTCYAGTRQMIMPNGDFVEGPLNFAAAEYRCVWKRPGTKPLVRYVENVSPLPIYTDKLGMGFHLFNRIYFLYSQPVLWRDQSFWDKFLKEFMEGSKNPTLEGLPPDMAGYARELSAMGREQLRLEYAEKYTMIFHERAPFIARLLDETFFGSFMKRVYDKGQNLQSDHEAVDRFFLVLREYIYRGWDAGLKPRSYTS